MNHPWEEIDLNDYENHMRLDNVLQLQTLNDMMKQQFYCYPVKSVMILGIAGGNGLEHLDGQIIDRVYGVDINESYLAACTDRYPQLESILHTIHADLTQDRVMLPYADLLIANLFIEYIGYERFQKIVEQIKPRYVSCVIQIDANTEFVSDSPYIHVFDRLAEVHHQINQNEFISALNQVAYKEILYKEEALPNGKKLVRSDFASKE